MINYNQKFISYALSLAKKNLGLTAPNPVVGCIIVKDNVILASGVTAPNGRPHAEKIAIDKISDKKILQDCEIYVTLEPCCHFGQTPPCVDEIIKYKFKNVRA
jgi:diaminohydroxyphosphoribosylaminopyrimidine deaminase/5-amino-6-(5-phosphoribosylamino)uracil reductase